MTTVYIVFMIVHTMITGMLYYKCRQYNQAMVFWLLASVYKAAEPSANVVEFKPKSSASKLS